MEPDERRAFEDLIGDVKGEALGKGYSMGLTLGFELGRVTVLTYVLQTRFGEIPEDAALYMATPEQVGRMIEIMLSAPSLEAVLAVA